jgi:hypothetical protein
MNLKGQRFAVAVVALSGTLVLLGALAMIAAILSRP